MNQKAKETVKSCMLSPAQQAAILKGIGNGKLAYAQTMERMPKTSSQTYASRLLYELVNTHVEGRFYKIRCCI